MSHIICYQPLGRDIARSGPCISNVFNELADDKDVRPTMSSYGEDVLEFTDFGDWDLAATRPDCAFNVLSARGIATSICTGEWEWQEPWIRSSFLLSSMIVFLS